MEVREPLETMPSLDEGISLLKEFSELSQRWPCVLRCMQKTLFVISNIETCIHRTKLIPKVANLY